MPAEGLPWLPKSDILSYEEIAEVVGQLAPLGLRRRADHRRRADDPSAARRRSIRMLRAVPEIEDIALSTNGVRLPELARALRDAGLDRVNMSVDSLRPDRIATIARRDLALRSGRRGDWRPRRRASRRSSSTWS